MKEVLESIEMNNEGRIKRFIMETFIKGDEQKPLLDDSSFLEEGIIDSVGVLELVAFLEEEFGCEVGDEEIIPENLDSINRLVAFVQSKQAAV